MGHNEDGDTISVNNSFVVHARVVEPASGLVEEFTAMCYAAELCGNAFGFNLKTGVVFTVNAVFPKTVNTSAIRKQFCHLKIDRMMCVIICYIFLVLYIPLLNWS